MPLISLRESTISPPAEIPFSWSDGVFGRACAAAGVSTKILSRLMDLADDISYSVHDVEDGVHAASIAITASGTIGM